MKKTVLNTFGLIENYTQICIITAVILTNICRINAQTVTTIGQVNGDPSGIALDAAGFVYIAERAPASKITKLNQSTGITTTFSSSGINDPLDIGFGPNNKLFVADYAAGNILSIPSTGGSATNYVSGATGPCGFVFDGDTLYYIEYVSQKIFQVLPGGGVVGGPNVIQVSDSALWMGPNARGTGLELLPDGNLFVTAANSGQALFTVNKQTGAIINNLYCDDNALFNAVRLSDDQYYSAGSYTNKIYKWNSSISTSDAYVFMGNGNDDSVDGSDTIASFSGCYYIANDANDNLYVTDYNSKKIRKISNAIASFNELEKENISIYPNPTNSIVNISTNELSTLTILSSQGKQITVLSGASNYTFDASHLDAGIYFIQTDKGSTQKFIKN